MNEDRKLTLKRVELSLSKFNEVAIPHHLDLLRQHKANILKLEQSGTNAHNERIRARRVVQQLRVLLTEVESLRSQVRDEDLQKFDEKTERARELTLRAIMDYLGMIEVGCNCIAQSAPMSFPTSKDTDSRTVSASLVSSDSVGLVCEEHPDKLTDDVPQLQIYEDPANSLESRTEALQSWSELQESVQDLHSTWSVLHRAALTQRRVVSDVDAAVETAAEDVEVAAKSLADAARSRRRMALGVGGAALGLLAGGPAGLVLGAKLGVMSGLAAAAVGYVVGVTR